MISVFVIAEKGAAALIAHLAPICQSHLRRESKICSLILTVTMIAMQHLARSSAKSTGLAALAHMLLQGVPAAPAAIARLHSAPGDADWAVCSLTASSERASTVCVQGSHSTLPSVDSDMKRICMTSMNDHLTMQI